MLVKRARCASLFFFSQPTLLPHFVPVISFFQTERQMSAIKSMTASLV